MASLRYLIGPELIWLIAYFLSMRFKQVSLLKAGAYNKFIENYAMFLPVLILALTMCLYAIPVVPRKFLLLRIVIVAFVATNFVLENVLNGHSEGGPGVGTIFIVAYGFLLFALIAAIVIKVIFIK